MVTPFGLRVKVHVPDEGSPLSAIRPVDTAQVGCVTAPVTGAVGVGG